MNTRKSAIVIVVFLIAVGAAYTGYWFYARGVAVQIIDNWAAQRRAEGYKVAFDAPVIDGYPLLVRAVLGKPLLLRDAFVWRGEKMKIEFQPWNFHRIRIDLEGKQWVTLRENADPAILEPVEAAIVVTLSTQGRFSNASLLLRELRLSDSAGATLLQAAEIWLEATAPNEPPADHTDEGMALSLSAADIVLPEKVDGPLGRTVSKLRADLQVRGEVPGGPLEEALETWRRNGGTVDVDWLHVTWGNFDLRAKGTIALDAEARPLGAFSTDIRGHNHALDALVAHSVLEPNTATFAKVALSLLAKSPPEGGAPVLTIPVTAQNGRLYAGPLKILDLDPIRFPAPPR